MKRIERYRKLMGVEENTALQELKTMYRTLMKDWHPDKFHDNHEKKLEAEDKSKKIIEAYHFLVSIAPETREQMKAAYEETTSKAAIEDFEYKSEILTVSFLMGLFMNTMGFLEAYILSC